MNNRFAVTATITLACLATAPRDASAQTSRVFANCTAMHRVYPHGVGKLGAHDRTSGTPVTTFKRDNTLYRANARSDRDKDGIACEKL